MEPSEFDQIIKSKLEQENDLHQHEIERSKPFVWTAIQQTNKTKVASVPWYYFAAAIALLLIGFSFFLFNQQQVHDKQLSILSKKVESLQKTQDVTPSDIVAKKNEQIDLICHEMEQLELSLSSVNNNQPSANNIAHIVYKTDTVFVNAVEYITEYKVPIESKQENQDDPTSLLGNESEKISDIIYPDFKKSTIEPAKATASVKVKLASFGPQ